jgi:hypothetical protein
MLLQNMQAPRKGWLVLIVVGHLHSQVKVSNVPICPIDASGELHASHPVAGELGEFSDLFAFAGATSDVTTPCLNENS